MDGDQALLFEPEVEGGCVPRAFWIAYRLGLTDSPPPVDLPAWCDNQVISSICDHVGAIFHGARDWEGEKAGGEVSLYLENFEPVILLLPGKDEKKSPEGKAECHAVFTYDAHWLLRNGGLGAPRMIVQFRRKEPRLTVGAPLKP